MNELTFEEKNLVCIYNSAGTREGVVAALRGMRGYLDADETELRNLTDSALRKLEGMSDAEFSELDLFPEFDGEDAEPGAEGAAYAR